MSTVAVLHCLEMMTRNHFWSLPTPKYFQSVPRVPSFFQDFPPYNLRSSGCCSHTGQAGLRCAHFLKLPLFLLPLAAHGSAVWPLPGNGSRTNTNKNHNSKSVHKTDTGPSLTAMTQGKDGGGTSPACRVRESVK